MSGSVTAALALACCVAIVGDASVDAIRKPPLAGKQVLMVIAHENFRDEELNEPKAILERAGAKVVTASSSVSRARGMLGGAVKPDILLKDARARDYDAVIFVGGSGASEYFNDSRAHALARDAAKAGKLVCAICIAPVTLANAGLLSGKRATVWPSMAGAVRAKGARYTGARVEVHGKIITADGPQSARAFGEAIVQALK